MTKKVSKKSIEYVRPPLGRFRIEKFPDHEFRFRKITVDDEAWCIENLGSTPAGIVTSKVQEAEKLCELYFNFLEDDDKELFIPVKRKVRNYKTGEETDEIIPGHKLFMQSISGGLAELTMIGYEFVKTMLACRPISELPEDIKKSLLKSTKKVAAKSEPGPMGSTIVDLRSK